MSVPSSCSRTGSSSSGCGNFLDDYEGIGGYEELRPDLSLTYFPTVDPATGRLSRLCMTPMQIRKFQARRASLDDARWLRDTINRESRRFGFRVELQKEEGAVALRPTPSGSLWRASLLRTCE
jgi:poly-gamma-glutamate synthesis protein (capsule biosynthesis protein)